MGDSKRKQQAKADAEEQAKALVADAIAEHEKLIAADNSKLEHAFVAGHKLLAAKKMILKGKWKEWLAEHWVKPGRSDRTARRYMKLAKNEQTIRAKWPRVAKMDEAVEAGSIRTAEYLISDGDYEDDQDTDSDQNPSGDENQTGAGEDADQSSADATGDEQPKWPYPGHCPSNVLLSFSKQVIGVLDYVSEHEKAEDARTHAAEFVNRIASAGYVLGLKELIDGATCNDILLALGDAQTIWLRTLAKGIADMVVVREARSEKEPKAA
jgi:hypothetical protein